MSIGRGKLMGCAVAGLMSLAAVEIVRTQQAAGVNEQAEIADGPLARVVRQSTAPFQDPQAAVAAGMPFQVAASAARNRGRWAYIT